MYNIIIKLRILFNKLFLVSIGSIPASILRYEIRNDLVVNLLGVLVLGFLIGYKANSRLRLIFAVGFCGALTTFSGWIMECLELFVQGYLIKGISLIIFPVIFGLIFSGIGMWMGSSLKIQDI